MEVEVMEAEFASRILICKATVRVVDFKNEEQAKLITLVLKNADTMLEALDGINELENPKHVADAFKLVEEVVVAQQNVAVDIMAKALEKTRNEILSRMMEHGTNTK